MIENKAPEITLSFWIIKITATTLGETGGDAVSMSMNLGYLLSTGIFAILFLALVFVQIKTERYNPYLYWSVIVATTTVGTTLADFVTRSIGIGYTGGSLILLSLLVLSLVFWKKATGSVSVNKISSSKEEIFYWVTIMFSQTLGTALGDWAADTARLGYLGAAVIFGGMILVTALVYKLTDISRTALFWVAFIMTRPLGAVVGDFLDKPQSAGGLELSRYSASGCLIVFMIACIVWFESKKHSEANC